MTPAKNPICPNCRDELMRSAYIKEPDPDVKGRVRWVTCGWFCQNCQHFISRYGEGDE